MSKTTNIKQIKDINIFWSKFKKIDDGFYFSDGNIYITVKHSKFGKYNQWDFVGNDGNWTNYVDADDLEMELFEYYNELNKNINKVNAIDKIKEYLVSKYTI
jgi:hypothetical protein